MSRAAKLIARSLVLATVLAAPGVAGASTEDERVAAVRCDGVPGAAKAPVLLVPGTGVNAEQNWSWGYATVLRSAGHGVCTVDPPDRSRGDVQDSVLFVRTAIEEVARRDPRPMAVIGHSQGAFHAVHVLRLFPDLAPLVDDVVGLAGLYERGSDAVRRNCSAACSPALWQVATGSRYMNALPLRPLPAGPSYTAIGTRYDTVVTPQPAVNALRGGQALQIQDVCPGRRVVEGLDHIYLAADAVAHALTMDALEHQGAADPERVSQLTCVLPVFLGADLVKLALLGPSLAAALAPDDSTNVREEPPVRCPLADGCPDAAAFPVVRFARTTITPPARILLRVRAARSWRLRLRVGGPAAGLTPSVSVRSGTRTVAVSPRFCRSSGGRRRCRVPGAGRHRLLAEVRPAGAATWSVLVSATLRVRRR